MNRGAVQSSDEICPKICRPNEERTVRTGGKPTSKSVISKNPALSYSSKPSVSWLMREGAATQPRECGNGEGSRRDGRRRR